MIKKPKHGWDCFYESTVVPILKIVLSILGSIALIIVGLMILCRLGQLL